MDWIDPAQDRDKLSALVNTVMNLRFTYNVGEIFEQLRNWRLLKKDSTPCSYYSVGIFRGKVFVDYSLLRLVDRAVFHKFQIDTTCIFLKSG
jgi:hypothetical protein